MCTNGVNTDQLESMIDMADDYVAVGFRWIHKMAHMAEDGGFGSASVKLHEVQALLADARALLDEAKLHLEEKPVFASGISVRRV